MFIFDSTFAELATLFALTATVSAIGLLLRQPLVISFILVGILAGPAWLDMIQASEVLELLSEMGIAILLFVVGLKLDIQLVRGSGIPTLVIGAVQMGLTFALGMPLALAFGLSVVEATYVSLALCFSSTVILVKLLSDKREIDALHGQLAVGVLIAQDIAVILVLIALSAFGGESSDSGVIEQVGLVALKGAALLGAVALLMRFGATQVVHFLSRSSELLVLSVIAWAMALAAVGDALGFSKEVGAFLAGIVLASTPLRDVISARLVTLRDFLLLFFFLNLGTTLELGGIATVLGAALVLSLFVLVAKPVIIFATMALLGYRRRTGFLTGASLGQISEFSLILGALGISVGHIGDDTLILITVIGVATIAVSTYGILYSHPLYERVGPLLERFERATPRDNGTVEGKIPPADVVLFGLGRYGSNIARHLQDNGLAVLGVDFDPQAVRRWRERGLETLFGDAEDPEFTHSLPIEHARLVVGAIPWLDSNLALVSTLKLAGYQGQIAVTVHSEQEEALLRQAGADLILWPFVDAAERASALLFDATVQQGAAPEPSSARAK